MEISRVLELAGRLLEFKLPDNVIPLLENIIIKGITTHSKVLNIEIDHRKKAFGNNIFQIKGYPTYISKNKSIINIEFDGVKINYQDTFGKNMTSNVEKSYLDWLDWLSKFQEAIKNENERLLKGIKI